MRRLGLGALDVVNIDPPQHQSWKIPHRLKVLPDKPVPTNVYGGPCPPSGIIATFKLYALDNKLSLSSFLKEELENMQGHVILQAELVGLYSRKIAFLKSLGSFPPVGGKGGDFILQINGIINMIIEQF